MFWTSGYNQITHRAVRVYNYNDRRGCFLIHRQSKGLLISMGFKSIGTQQEDRQQEKYIKLKLHTITETIFSSFLPFAFTHSLSIIIGTPAHM